MNYTVIQKSGWQGDNWKVAETFQSKTDAEAYANSKQQAVITDDFYYVKVKSHRQPLSKLADENFDTVRFSDGTEATWG